MQLLLDTHSLKTCLLELPSVGAAVARKAPSSWVSVARGSVFVNRQGSVWLVCCLQVYETCSEGNGESWTNYQGVAAIEELVNF